MRKLRLRRELRELLDKIFGAIVMISLGLLIFEMIRGGF